MVGNAAKTIMGLKPHTVSLLPGEFVLAVAAVAGAAGAAAITAVAAHTEVVEVLLITARIIILQQFLHLPLNAINV